MGSRRRLHPSTTVENDCMRPSPFSDIESSLQLLPTVKKGKNAEAPRIEDYLGHQKWHYKRQPALHPALTDFGPETLQRFLQAEVAKMDNLTSSVRNKQEQELRNFARSLINAQSDVHILRDEGKTAFKIRVPLARPSPSAKDVSVQHKDKVSPRKGKKPVPRVPQPHTYGEHFGYIASQPSQSLIQPPTRRSLSSDRASLTARPCDPLTVVSQTSYEPVYKSKSRRSLSFQSRSDSISPQGNSADRLISQPVKRISVCDGGQQPAQNAGDTSKLAKWNDKSLSHNISPAPKNYTVSAQEQPPFLLEDGEQSSKVRLSRTSSFETHASNSRDSLRSNTKTSTKRENQQPDEMKRRRKTPLSLDFDRNSQARPQLRPYTTPSGPGTGYDPNFRSRFGSPAVGVARVVFEGQSSSVRCRSSDATLRHSRSVDAFQTGASMDLSLSDVEDIVMMDADMSANLAEQRAILESLAERQKAISELDGHNSRSTLMPYDYRNIVPEDMPLNVKQAEINRCRVWQAHGLDGHGKGRSNMKSESKGPFTLEQIDPSQQNILDAPDEHGDYPRRYRKPSFSENSKMPMCRKSFSSRTSLPVEIWEADTGKTPGGVVQYLSSTEIRNLRLVCKSLAEDLEPYVFRNVVAKFNPSLFSLYPSYSSNGKLEINEADSMLRKYGSEMNKFGISFEIDINRLTSAPFKVTETKVNAWFGNYVWPVKDYPYFSSLRDIDKLLDDERRLLTQAMKNLTKCRELAISVDSGHGWLEGPDLSDLSIYRAQAINGSKVFGKTFSASDRMAENGLKEMFKWAQANTINENTKYLEKQSKTLKAELERLQSIAIRDYDSYRVEKDQPDYTKHLHTGGAVDSDPAIQPANPATMQTNAFLANFPVPTNFLPPTGITPMIPSVIAPPQPPPLQNWRHRFHTVMDIVSNNQGMSDSHGKVDEKTIEAIQPQWPVIFNGFNLAAESRGDSNYVQNRVAVPSAFPLLPNCLTESQAQWLMETSWIQRTFLSAYTDAVRVNAPNLSNVHSLHISKISSGLLTALSHKSFWSSLKALRKITILVKPDWRVEHIPGDKFFQTNMSTDPITATYKFAELLENYIVPLEHLNSLHIGYLGGGEHQAGVFGRNQNILPAPITQHPQDWFVAQNSSKSKPNSNTILVFPHVRTLTLENCWLSPLLLEHFMIRCRDTSLHHLILDSVSLTAQINSSRTDGPLRTVDNQLKCHHDPSAWLNETIPANAAWVNVLEKITPGQTIIDHKYEAGMIDEEKSPRPEPHFRGNIEQISLRSCGYVKVLGISSNDFNQNELVFQNVQWVAMDEGLKIRASKFTKTIHYDSQLESAEEDGIEDADVTTMGRRRGIHMALPNTINPQNNNSRARSQRQPPKEARPRTTSRFIMLSGRPAHTRGESIFVSDENTHGAAMNGYLTQCIHPIEKRVLERMWGMRFGWGDDMRRWEAVEDGWFMGGTGRFSGEVYKDSALQRAACLSVANEDQEDEVLVEDRNDKSKDNDPSSTSEQTNQKPGADDSATQSEDCDPDLESSEDQLSQDEDNFNIPDSAVDPRLMAPMKGVLLPIDNDLDEEESEIASGD